nr:AMP-binding protein [Thermoleophilaceae bacterium]
MVAGGRGVTYAELDREADTAARRLAALGVTAGDRVATTLPAGIQLVALLNAVARVGAALVPLDARLTASERRAQLDETAPRLVIEEPLAGEQADRGPRARIDPDEPWTILFTSGTTGRPKPVALSHRNHVASAIASAWGLGVAPDDRWLCVLPLFHVGGLAIPIR